MGLLYLHGHSLAEQNRAAELASSFGTEGLGRGFEAQVKYFLHHFFFFLTKPSSVITRLTGTINTAQSSEPEGLKKATYIKRLSILHLTEIQLAFTHIFSHPEYDNCHMSSASFLSSDCHCPCPPALPAIYTVYNVITLKDQCKLALRLH